MPKLSVILITYNEEKTVERCLRSVAWAEEIIVVDSFSTDRTVELAKKFTPIVIQHEYDGDIPQRQRGFDLSKGEWLLYIDADEEATEELKAEILTTISSPGAKDGYFVPRKVRAFGKWIRHGGWYPDYSFRLFRKDKYAAEPAEVHGGFTVNGEKGRLNSFLLHYSYESIEHYIDKMNVYTSLQITNKLRENVSAVHLTKVLLSPASHFFRKFISQRGYRDGFHGFVLAVLGALYTLALYTKLWEYRFREREGKGVLPPITNVEIRKFQGLP